MTKPSSSGSWKPSLPGSETAITQEANQVWQSVLPSVVDRDKFDR